MATNVPILSSAAELDQLCQQIRQATIFALDTEFVTEHTYSPVLSLIQVATPDATALIDALVVDVAPIWELVADPAVEVVMHGAEAEARFCWMAAGRMPQSLFDVQLAVAFTGDRFPMNYSSLVQAVLGIQMRQNQTRTDWTRRPLAAAQLSYAAEDVVHLLAVRDEIAIKLDRSSRLAWYIEESQRKLDAIEHDLRNPRWWRVSGAQGLSRRSLAALREIYFWREDLAERRDLPRKRILRDDLIASAASSLPTNEDELRRLRGFEKRNAGDVRELLDCLRRARDLPDAELPESRREARQQSTARMLALLLEAVLHETCADQEIDAALVGTASDLRELLRWHLTGRSPDKLPDLMQGWRGVVCGDILEAVLAGDVSIAVADPASRRPLAIEQIAPPD